MVICIIDTLAITHQQHIYTCYVVVVSVKRGSLVVNVKQKRPLKLVLTLHWLFDNDPYNGLLKSPVL